MFAIIAAIILALALLLDLADANVGDAFNTLTLITAGLFFLALHLAGVGTAWGGRWGGRGRRR